MSDKQPRGLMLHNNPFSYKTGNGKTIANMFGKWDAENLAQIYVSNLEPDFDICADYYKITDLEALKSFLFHIKIGNEIRETHKVQETEVTKTEGNFKKIVKNVISESSFAAYIRDLIWRKSDWKNENLNEWLDKIKPEFVVLAGGNISAFYDMAGYICQKYQIPLYIHLGDDYYIYRHGNIWRNMQRKRMSDCLQQAISNSAGVIAICDKMVRVFQEKYGGNYIVCMNSVDMNHKYKQLVKKERNQTIKMVYAGNLGINRWKILNLVGLALQELQKEGIYCELSIYSSYVPAEKIRKKLTIPPVMKFCGSVYGEHLCEIKENADILIHVEAFEKKYRELTYTAMSTKIPEYLSSGRIILGVGPQEAASIEFLEQNNLALVVKEKSKEQIKHQIRRYWDEFDRLLQMTERAKSVAEERFSQEENSAHIYNTIMNQF